MLAIPSDRAGSTNGYGGRRVDLRGYSQRCRRTYSVARLGVVGKINGAAISDGPLAATRFRLSTRRS